MVFHREKSEFEPARRTRLVEDAGQVVLDRLQTDRESLGDLTVVLAVADRGDDFHFAGGELEGPRTLAVELPGGAYWVISNLGADATIGAPGGNCVNTGAGQPCLFSIETTTNAGTTTPANDTYTDQQNYNVGTSFSAPIVSGVAALMLSVNQNLSVPQLIARLRQGATPYPAAPTGLAVCRVPANTKDLQSAECACTTVACGAGMTNAVGALREARRPIAAIAARSMPEGSIPRIDRKSVV